MCVNCARKLLVQGYKSVNSGLENGRFTRGFAAVAQGSTATPARAAVKQGEQVVGNNPIVKLSAQTFKSKGPSSAVVDAAKDKSKTSARNTPWQQLFH
jgi:hypothetical protein